MRIQAAAALLLLCALEASAEQPRQECRGCIAVYGDSRSGHKMHKRIVEYILNVRPALMFHLGDMVADGDHPEQWRKFEDLTADLRRRTEFYPVFGNHDLKGEREYFSLFPKLEGRKWYELNRFGVRFLVLDSNSPLKPGSEQREWLETRLKEEPEGTAFIAVLLHHPIFSSGYHGPMKDAGELAALFEKAKVDVAFSGHDHVYERSFKDGVAYVVTAGGGAPLYPKKRANPYCQVFLSTFHYCALSIHDDRLSVEVFDRNNSKIDSFEINSRR